jgi:hypothetical protein
VIQQTIRTSSGDRAGRGASGLAMVVPHAVVAAVSGKSGWERSGQGDFVKLEVQQRSGR